MRSSLVRLLISKSLGRHLTGDVDLTKTNLLVKIGQVFNSSYSALSITSLLFIRLRPLTIASDDFLIETYWLGS